MTKQDVLDQCRVEGNNVFLPDIQLERPLYVEVDKALKGMGGKWNRGVKAHVFPSDPSALLGRVQNGETINLKKEFQFFETPEDLAIQMADLLEVDASCNILEPSAGRGALIK